MDETKPVGMALEYPTEQMVLAEGKQFEPTPLEGTAELVINHMQEESLQEQPLSNSDV